MARSTTGASLLACACLGALALSACTRSAPTPVPTPTAYACAAPGQPTPTACSQDEFRRLEEQKRLYAEAERVYQDFTAERTRAAHAGGTETPTPRMTELATGPALDEAVKYLRDQRSRSITVTGELVATVMGPEFERSRPDQVVALRACEDGRGTEAHDSQGNSLGNGRVVNVRLFFKSVDNRLKLFDWDGKAGPQCGDFS